MKQYIVVRVNNQLFGISVLSASKILPLINITWVPDTENYILGVTDSEDTIIPVIDLGMRFFDKKLAITDTTQTVVVYWGDKEIALLVDEIVEISAFDESKLDKNLDKITSLEQAETITPIKSFIRSEESIILELDIDDLFDMVGSLKIKEFIESYK